MKSPNEKHPIQSDSKPCVSISEMVYIFYEDALELGQFKQIDHAFVPDVYQKLLNHTKHMTVTVEDHHQDQVGVQVLRSEMVGNHYCREILLHTLHDRKVVQYGIVRLNTRFLAQEPLQEILQQQKPLGRVLIEHDVLREIELFDLLEVQCGPVLAQLFHVPERTLTYGRTALLHCDREPAIELLEIVIL